MNIDGISKDLRYSALVEARKQCRKCCSTGLTNPSSVQDGKFDSKEIGPWTRWNGDLNARLLVVGQDWGDVVSFERQRGIDISTNATNQMLRELLASIGLNVDEASRHTTASGVFLTNAVLCLKRGGAQAEVSSEWFDNCGCFLRAQVEIVRPKVVVTLGERAYKAMCHAFELRSMNFRDAINNKHAIRLPGDSSLVPVFHCGRRILNTHRKREEQLEDWKLVKQLLTSETQA
jgi:uracil-DNA glycosylase family 4